MRIRNSCIPLPLSSIDHVQNGAAALTANHFWPALARSPETPVIMVSRINDSISSEGDSVDEKKINSKLQESENGIIKEMMNFCTQAANQSWCEEEKVIPLKKRRVSFERNMISKKEKEINESDVSEELRCRRSDGKKWRCGRKRVEGYSMCAHHLERRR